MVGKMPDASGTKERISFVVNTNKEAMLVPRSWLKDPSKRAALHIGDKTDSFTSLISFSATFGRDEDDEDDG